MSEQGKQDAASGADGGTPGERPSADGRGAAGEAATESRRFLSPGATAAARDGEPASGPMEGEDRHGFVSAFVGGVRAEGEEGRGHGKRLLTVGISVAVVAAVATLVAGALSADDGKKSTKDTLAGSTASPSPHGSASGHPTPARGSAHPAAGQGDGVTTQNQPRSGTSPSPTGRDGHAAAAKRQAAVTYSAVSGYGCGDQTTHYYAKDADYSSSGGWRRSSTGGYTGGGGCSRTYLSVPMSGDAKRADPSQGVLWRFHYAASATPATCRLSVYIPDNDSITYVGGDPTTYHYYTGDYTFGMDRQPAGGFAISQVANRGRWVEEKSFQAESGVVVLAMSNTGIDYTSSTKNAHHAAAPVRLSCSTS